MTCTHKWSQNISVKRGREREREPWRPFLAWPSLLQLLSQRCASYLPVHRCLHIIPTPLDSIQIPEPPQKKINFHSQKARKNEESEIQYDFLFFDLQYSVRYVTFSVSVSSNLRISRENHRTWNNTHVLISTNLVERSICQAFHQTPISPVLIAVTRKQFHLVTPL